MAKKAVSTEISSQLEFRESFKASEGKPLALDPNKTVLIFDRRLPRVSADFRSWARQFSHQYAVESGESLKDIRRFPAHVERLSKIAKSLSPREMTVVAVGGGSVGDFAGFFASVFKRGVRLVHVPSTWLAAIDSSHGGKTALNVGGAKNQIGTFYLASRVILVRSLLLSQPASRVQDAMGELGKIALTDGGAWVKRLERSNLTGAELLWEFLKPAIQAKMKVVARDPQERGGERQVLNFGHTLGHVIEAAYGLQHGQAVAQGLFFALEFSERSGLLKEAVTERSMKLLSERMGLCPELPKKKLASSRFLDLLLADKKRAGANQVTFIFLKAIGQPVRAVVSSDDLLDEARRQGWVEAG